jgi:hypothetical protein
MEKTIDCDSDDVWAISPFRTLEIAQTRLNFVFVESEA